ncbi:MAG: tRNA uridine-5-carboxymethylaminomethyl(34) synthesis GTPase MnmE, partial [bacterium]|nr:tRNA uridine-5-carboxymethylaminomethyl(34) synthesis GTPase MnmE [bacterium]
MERPSAARTDTICSISTPPGMGGIGIVRMSGPRAVAIAGELFDHPRGKDLGGERGYSIRHGRLVEPATGADVDEVLLTVMRAPRTYTREDVVEINCHSGPVILRKILHLLTAHGARLAEPGEFTRRAFLNGRIDLAQAESVMSLISAKTDTALRAALRHLGGELTAKIEGIKARVVHLLSEVEAAIDFPDEELDLIKPHQVLREAGEVMDELAKLIRSWEEGKVLAEGVAAAIVGKANVGKSSLLNRLLMEDRAIVTPIPGTTRDVIEAMVNINGIPLRILDTAGIRASLDPVEQEGIRRSRESIEKADLVIMVVDGAQPPDDEDLAIARLLEGKETILVLNKHDLLREKEDAKWSKENIYDIIRPKKRVITSMTVDKDVDVLKKAISDVVLRGRGGFSESLIVTSVRHGQALTSAREAMARVCGAAKEGLSEEFLSVDLRGALFALGEITGETTTEEILDEIFRS